MQYIGNIYILFFHFYFMKRKIIKQAHNSLTITLPSEWTKQFNLKPGDEINLLEKNNGLFISTERKEEKLKAEIDISDFDIPTIWKYFMGVYREGYDEILVKFKPGIALENPYKFLTQHRLDIRYKKEREKRPISRALQGFVDRFIGFEIIEHGKDFILIKDMGELTSREFDNSLRRVFLLVQQMAEETLEAIKTNNPNILIHIHDVDINLDKFHDYCIRVLNKIGIKESRKSSLYFSTLYLLEMLGDEFKNIATHLICDFPKSKFKHIEKIAESVKEQIDTYYNLFYNFSEEKIKRISKLDKEIYLHVPDMYKKANEDEKEVFHHLRIIGRYLNSLMELRIEMEF